MEKAAEAPVGHSVYWHPRAVFPRVLLRSGAPAPKAVCVSVGLGVEDIGSFMMANGSPNTVIEGSLLSPYRRALAFKALSIIFEQPK